MAQAFENWRKLIICDGCQNRVLVAEKDFFIVHPVPNNYISRPPGVWILTNNGIDAACWYPQCYGVSCPNCQAIINIKRWRIPHFVDVGATKRLYGLDLNYNIASGVCYDPNSAALFGLPKPLLVW